MEASGKQVRRSDGRRNILTLICCGPLPWQLEPLCRVKVSGTNKETIERKQRRKGEWEPGIETEDRHGGINIDAGSEGRSKEKGRDQRNTQRWSLHSTTQVRTAKPISTWTPSRVSIGRGFKSGMYEKRSANTPCVMGRGVGLAEAAWLRKIPGT